MAHAALLPDPALPDNDVPIVFKVGTIPPKPKLQLSFRFIGHELRLWVDLYKLLALGEAQRVAFVVHKGCYYITRCDAADGFYVGVARYKTKGISSAVISNKPFLEQLRIRWGHEPGDLVRVPVAGFAVKAGELSLDAAQYPYPFYRLATDQKRIRAV